MDVQTYSNNRKYFAFNNKKITLEIYYQNCNTYVHNFNKNPKTYLKKKDQN